MTCRGNTLLAEDMLCMLPKAGMPKEIYRPAVWQLLELCTMLDISFVCSAPGSRQILGQRTSRYESFTIALEFDGSDYSVKQKP